MNIEEVSSILKSVDLKIVLVRPNTGAVSGTNTPFETYNIFHDFTNDLVGELKHTNGQGFGIRTYIYPYDMEAKGLDGFYLEDKHYGAFDEITRANKA